MPIPDTEEVFRFICWDDYSVDENGVPSISSGLFKTRAITVSVNLGSIWPLDQHKKVAPTGWGICGLLGSSVAVIRGNGQPLEINPDPINAPDVDPLLKIPNPAHASFDRRLTGGEAHRAARIATQMIFMVPTSASSRRP